MEMTKPHVAATYVPIHPFISEGCQTLAIRQASTRRSTRKTLMTQYNPNNPNA